MKLKKFWNDKTNDCLYIHTTKITINDYCTINKSCIRVYRISDKTTTEKLMILYKKTDLLEELKVELKGDSDEPIYFLHDN